MKKALISALLVILVVGFTGCRPFSKESYLERYGEFMKEVSEKSAAYTEEDWKNADKKYKQFNEDWYKHFKEDLTWQEGLTVTGYSVKYNIYRNIPKMQDLYDTYLKGDIQKLKEQIKYYKENKMDDDINALIKKAKEVSDSSATVIQNLVEEVGKEIKK